jgi:hypothetical protein
MNERIRELAEHCWINDGGPDSYFSQQKFAELIVRECAEQVDWILAEGGKTQGDLIKEHFGIES